MARTLSNLRLANVAPHSTSVSNQSKRGRHKRHKKARRLGIKLPNRPAVRRVNWRTISGTGTTRQITEHVENRCCCEDFEREVCKDGGKPGRTQCTFSCVLASWSEATRSCSMLKIQIFALPSTGQIREPDQASS